MYYFLEFLSNHQPATWKVEIAEEPALVVDQQILDTLYKFTRKDGTYKLYKPGKICIRFLHPIPDNRFVFTRRVIVEKVSSKLRICEESSEPFMNLYWAFSYFNSRGIGQSLESSLGYKPDLMLYKFGKNDDILKKWHLKNVSVISFSVEAGFLPSIENCTMEIIPENFLQQI